MRARPLAAIAVALVAMALAAAPAAARQVTVTSADRGTTVTVRAGDTIRILLAANETTGYRWRITGAPRPRVARVRAATYLPARGVLPGAGGRQRYLLLAARPGRTRFAAVYEQVGSHDVGSAFAIRIRVRPRLS